MIFKNVTGFVRSKSKQNLQWKFHIPFFHASRQSFSVEAGQISALVQQKVRGHFPSCKILKQNGDLSMHSRQRGDGGFFFPFMCFCFSSVAQSWLTSWEAQSKPKGQALA